MFAGPSAPSALHDLFYYDVEVQLSDLVTSSAVLPVQIGEALAKLSDNQFARLFDGLGKRFPDQGSLQTLIAQLRPLLGPPPGSDAADRIYRVESAKAWNVPQRPSCYFTGRINLLNNLRKALCGDDPDLRTQGTVWAGWGWQNADRC